MIKFLKEKIAYIFCVHMCTSVCVCVYELVCVGVVDRSQS